MLLPSRRGLYLLFLWWTKERIYSPLTAHNYYNRRTCFKTGDRSGKKSPKENCWELAIPKPIAGNAMTIGDGHSRSQPPGESCDWIYNEISREKKCCVMWEALIKWYIGFIYLLFVCLEQWWEKYLRKLGFNLWECKHQKKNWYFLRGI